jgi:hypothetical protein
MINVRDVQESSELLGFLTLSIVQYSKTLENTKGDLIQSLHNRASTIYQEWQDMVNEISSLRCDLQLNSYPQVSLIPRVAA